MSRHRNTGKSARRKPVEANGHTLAVYRCRTDKELSLARAACISGVCMQRMKEILDRQGVPLRLGPATIEEARAEVAVLEEWLNADAKSLSYSPMCLPGTLCQWHFVSLHP